MAFEDEPLDARLAGSCREQQLCEHAESSKMRRIVGICAKLRGLLTDCAKPESELRSSVAIRLLQLATMPQT